MQKLIKVSPIDEDLVNDPDLYIYQYRAKSNISLWDKIIQNYYDAYGLEDFIMFERENEPLYMMEEFTVPDNCEVYVVRPYEIIDSYDVKSYAVPVTESNPIDYVINTYATAQIKYDWYKDHIFHSLREYVYGGQRRVSGDLIMERITDFFIENKPFGDDYFSYFALFDKKRKFDDEFFLFAAKKFLRMGIDKDFVIEKVERNETKVMQ